MFGCLNEVFNLIRMGIFLQALIVCTIVIRILTDLIATSMNESPIMHSILSVLHQMIRLGIKNVEPWSRLQALYYCSEKSRVSLEINLAVL